jgi:ribosomal protein S18 acetylase RimI-like enzyme
MSSQVSFRRYQRADLPACAGIAAGAFPLPAGRFSGEDVGKVMSGQIDGSLAMSNYAELALADGKVAGLIFGRLRSRPVLADTWRTIMQIGLITVGFLRGSYGSRGKLIRLLRPGLRALSVLRRNMPASEAEVVLFAVAPECQGAGIGRALMDRLVQQALRCSAESIVVPTDETASYWFYEKYGFTRWAEFDDPLESYFADRPIKGYIYQLLLHKAEGRE